MKKNLIVNETNIAEGFLGQKMIVLPNTIKESQKSNSVTRSFYISDMGYYPNASNHYCKRTKGANEYIFIYCVEGEGTLKLNAESIAVLPNSFYIVPKNTAHYYKAHENNPWSIYWIHFDGLASQNLYERYLEVKNNTNSIPFESERISLFNQIFQIYQSEYILPKLEYASILGLNLISSFVYNEVKDSVHMDSQNNVVDAIIAYLNDNLDKSFKSGDIANKFNYSSSYLFNLFKKRTGYSLIHFFNLKKIQKACEYLKYTDLSIKEISYKMSFHDPLYFSRIFKKFIGSSPREYRSQQQG